MPNTSPKTQPERADGRELKGEATRTALLDAVMVSVARNGIEGTTISRLAEISGLSRGLISFHFDGKDKLIEAALTRAITVYEQSWDAKLVTGDMTASERLHRAVDHDVDFALTNPNILSLWWAAWGEARAKDIYRASSSARDERFQLDLKTFFVSAGLAPAAAGQAAALLNTSLLGFWLQHHLDERTANPRQFRKAAHAMVDMLLSGGK